MIAERRQHDRRVILVVPGMLPEILSRGPWCAYRRGWQRVPGWISSIEHAASWLKEYPGSRNPADIKPAGRDIMKQAGKIPDYANGVSRPDRTSCAWPYARCPDRP